MSLRDQLVAIERTLWTSDTGVYDARLQDDAMFVFAETGMIDKATALAAIGQERRAGRQWEEAEILDARAAELTPDTALLVYRASARRAGEKNRHVALASSVYVKRAGEWMLAFHQQTASPESRSASAAQSLVRSAGAGFGPVAVRAAAVGALATAAAAIGAFAIGRLAVGAIAVGRGRVRSLTVDRLEVKDLRIGHLSR